MGFIFEKNKLYNLLGKTLIDVFKKHEVFIAGGTITSLFSNREVNDIDLYFRNERSLINFVEEIYEDSNDWVNSLTSKALLVRINDLEVQMIHFKYFETAEDIFNTFDYTVCMGAFDFSTEEFVLHNDFMKHNSQRILKFNKNTAFPIVSLLRVQKYKEKGYNISKPEFLRVALKIMTLDIKNIDDLKEQLGGLYGINYDKIIQLDENEEFSIEKVIDKIADLSLSEDYFVEPAAISFDGKEDIIEQIRKEPIEVVEIHNSKYQITHNSTLRKLNNDPKVAIPVNGKEYIEKSKFYKFVKKYEDRYFSHWDSKFEYIIGKEANPSGSDYLYFNEKGEIHESDYLNQGALLEVVIPYNEFSHKEREKVMAKKCFVIREVPKEEYEKWLNT